MNSVRPDFREHLSAEVPEEDEAQQRKYMSSWQGISAIVLAFLGIYLAWVPVLNLILALLALIFGIMGVRTREKTASVVAIVVGAFNLLLATIGLIGLAVIFSLFGSKDNNRKMTTCESACGVAVEQEAEEPEEEWYYGWQEWPVVWENQMQQVEPQVSNTRKARREEINWDRKQNSDEMIWRLANPQGSVTSIMDEDGNHLIEIGPDEYVVPLQTPYYGWN